MQKKNDFQPGLKKCPEWLTSLDTEKMWIIDLFWKLCLIFNSLGTCKVKLYSKLKPFKDPFPYILKLEDLENSPSISFIWWKNIEEIMESFWCYMGSIMYNLSKKMYIRKSYRHPHSKNPQSLICKGKVSPPLLRTSSGKQWKQKQKKKQKSLWKRKIVKIEIATWKGSDRGRRVAINFYKG